MTDIPRRCLIEWLQSDFDCYIERVEQCASGAMYLQIMDKAFPRKVPMQRVNWAATLEYEMVRNYKVLQDVFLSCGIARAFSIERLTQKRHQENLEFLQYIKQLHDKRVTDNLATPNYQAYDRRCVGQGPLPDWAGSKALGMRPPRAPTSHMRKASGRLAHLTSTSSTCDDERYCQQRIRELQEQLSDVTASKDFYLNKMYALEAYLQISEDRIYLDRETVEQILYHPELIDPKITFDE